MTRNFILAMLLFTPACFAQHEGDVGLVIQDSQLQTAVIADGQYVSGEQIFTASFGDSGFDFFTQNPGWDAAPGTFTPNATFFWSAVAGLRDVLGRKTLTLNTADRGYQQSKQDCNDTNHHQQFDQSESASSRLHMDNLGFMTIRCQQNG